MKISLTNSTPPREFLPVSIQLTFDALDEVRQFMNILNKGMYGDALTPLPPIGKRMDEVISILNDELKRQGF